MKNLLLQKPWVITGFIAVICFIIGYCGKFQEAAKKSTNQSYKDSLDLVNQEFCIAREKLIITNSLITKLEEKAIYLNKYIIFRQEELMDLCPKTHYHVSNKRRY